MPFLWIFFPSRKIPLGEEKSANRNQLPKYIQFQFYTENTCTVSSRSACTQNTDSSERRHLENYVNVKSPCKRWRNLHRTNEPWAYLIQEQCQEPNMRLWSLDPMSAFTWASGDWNQQKGTKEQAGTVPSALSPQTHTGEKQSAQKWHCTPPEDRHQDLLLKVFCVLKSPKILSYLKYIKKIKSSLIFPMVVLFQKRCMLCIFSRATKNTERN